MRIFGKALKWLFLLFIIAVNIAIFYRLFTFSYYPAAMTRITENEILTAAKKDGKIAAFTQKPAVDRDNDGNFFSKSLALIPDAKQLQVAVRFNNSTLAKIAEEYGLEAVPAADDARLRFVLRDDGGKVTEATDMKSAEAFMYHYRRLIFDGVTTDGINYLYLDIYFGDAPDYTAEPFGSMLVYESDIPLTDY